MKRFRRVKVYAHKYNPPKDGKAGVFTRELHGEGIFHGFFSDNDGEGQPAAVAIVELRDGTVFIPNAQDVEFIDGPFTDGPGAPTLADLARWYEGE